MKYTVHGGIHVLCFIILCLYGMCAVCTLMHVCCAGELKGVMRVGAFAHELLLKGECSADLVLLCEKKPTVSLFNVILRRLVSQFEVRQDHVIVSRFRK